MTSRSVLITGASSGIGSACAGLFLEQGWRVGLVARRADKLARIAEGREGAMALPADVTDPDAIAAAVAQFAAEGPLDVLFNNAGIFPRSAPIDDLAPEEFREAIDVNVTGMFNTARAAFAVMRAQGGGRIINNGSISAHSPRPDAVAYTVSKHAVTGLTRQLALDGRPLNIACGQIDIGNAESEIISQIKAMDPSVVTMEVDHAARSVLHMASLPLHANVMFMTVLATQMPYAGRG